MTSATLLDLQDALDLAEEAIDRAKPSPADPPAIVRIAQRQVAFRLERLAQKLVDQPAAG